MISFRADSEVERALQTLGATDGGSRTDVIKRALIGAARQAQSEQIRARAQYLAIDSDDLAESRAIREDMESVSAW
jgi:predicted transcriptional regulator